jgi:Cu2+-exporting ATPase
MTVSTINVPDMHCSACSGKIRSALKNLAGVDATYFNPSRRQVLVEHADTVASLELLKRIESAGFTPALSGVDAHDARQKTLLKRLGIAGLAMMQVMMAAIAMYAGDFQSMADSYRRLLEFTSLIFCIPVVAYSAMPFFTGALAAFRTGINMDVPIALAIGIAFTTSLYNTLNGTGHVYYDSVVMFTFLLLGARYIDARLQQRFATTDQALAALPEQALRIGDDGGKALIPVQDIAAGEKIWVSEGSQVPVDGQLLNDSARLDEAVLSGESEWVRKSTDESLWAGTINCGAGFSMTATARYDASRIADIAALANRAHLDRAPAALLADRVAAFFIPTVLVLASATFIIWQLIDPGRGLIAALTVLVVSCPCALSLATPAALTAAMTRLRDVGIVLTRSAALEQAASIDQALLDKTGTLTIHEPAITGVTVLSDQYPEPLCRTLAGALQQHSAHPYARAFAARAFSEGGSYELSNVEVVTGKGVRGRWNDLAVRIGSAEFCNAGDSDDRAIYLCINEQPCCRFTISDTIRSDARAAISQLKELGITPVMLSGDAPERCEALADELEIEFLARQTPETKLAFLQAQDAAGHQTLMLGDGINDVPVLAGARVSAAVVEASDLVKSNADALLLSRRLTPLPELVRVARRTQRITRQNLGWALAYNLIAIPIAAMGWMPPWLAALGMASSSTLVMFNATRILR